MIFKIALYDIDSYDMILYVLYDTAIDENILYYIILYDIK